MVTAISPGKAVITATSVDGGKKATCKVTVKDPTAEQLQIEAMRAQEIVAPPGYMLTINGRITNLIIELQIHKMRYEPNSTFRGIVQGMIMQGSGLTIKAKQYNSIATQVMHGSMKDDEAIAQLQALSLTR